MFRAELEIQWKSSMPQLSGWLYKYSVSPFTNFFTHSWQTSNINYVNCNSYLLFTVVIFPLRQYGNVCNKKFHKYVKTLFCFLFLFRYTKGEWYRWLTVPGIVDYVALIFAKVFQGKMIEVDSHSSLIKYKCVSSQKDHFRIKTLSMDFFFDRTVRKKNCRKKTQPIKKEGM